MNKRFVLAQLAKIANELDRNNLFSEANDVTDVMKNVEKKKSNRFFDLPGVFGGPRFGNEDQMMEQFRNETTNSKPPIDLGPFLPDEDIESNPEQNPSAEEEMGSSSDKAIVEKSLDEDVIVRYPGPTGKRHVIEWNVKTPAFPGQEVIIDWDTMALKKILPTSDAKRRMNMEMINTRTK